MKPFEPFTGFYQTTNTNTFIGGMVLIAGRPGSGKTMLMQNIAVNSSLSGNRVLFISSEQPNEIFKNNIKNKKINYLTIDDGKCDFYDVQEYCKRIRPNALFVSNDIFMCEERDRSKTYVRIIIFEKTSKKSRIKQYFDNRLQSDSIKVYEEILRSVKSVFIEKITYDLLKTSNSLTYRSSVIIEMQKDNNNFYIKIHKNRYGQNTNRMPLQVNHNNMKVAVM